MPDTNLSPLELATRVRQHLYQLRARNELYTSEDIADQLDLPHSQILATLVRLREIGAASTLQAQRNLYWTAGDPFIARKIVPLFAGTPEWIVESGSGELVGWFPREFLARITADALNRS